MKSEFLAIFEIRKNMKNPEISEIAISPQSHNPTIPQSPSFFPSAPQPRISAAEREKLKDCGMSFVLWVFWFAHVPLLGAACAGRSKRGEGVKMRWCFTKFAHVPLLSAACAGRSKKGEGEGAPHALVLH